jgi:hypothetical protein
VEAELTDNQSSGLRAAVCCEIVHGCTGESIANGLRQSGWMVQNVNLLAHVPLPSWLPAKVPAKFLRPLGVADYRREILRLVHELDLRVVITVKGIYFDRPFVRQLKALGVLVVNYYPDFHFEHQGVDFDAIPEFDLFVTTKSFQAPWLKALRGSSPTAYVAHGYAPLVHFPRREAVAEHEHRYDIAYIGSASEPKARWMSAVVRAFPDRRILLAGSGWANHPELGRFAAGALPGDFLAEATQLSRINLAFHYGPRPRPKSEDRGGPAEWEDFVSTRSFEIPACKGFMLHVDNPEARGLFRAGAEVDFFSDATGLCDLVETYLAEPERRQSMIDAAYARCVPAYSYFSRAREIADLIRAAL